jgi:hypothetical protein
MSIQTTVEIVKDFPETKLNLEYKEKQEITYPKTTNIVKHLDIQEIDLSACGPYVVFKFNSKDGKTRISRKNGITYCSM